MPSASTEARLASACRASAPTSAPWAWIAATQSTTVRHQKSASSARASSGVEAPTRVATSASSPAMIARSRRVGGGWAVPSASKNLAREPVDGGRSPRGLRCRCQGSWTSHAPGDRPRRRARRAVVRGLAARSSATGGPATAPSARRRGCRCRPSTRIAARAAPGSRCRTSSGSGRRTARALRARSASGRDAG